MKPSISRQFFADQLDATAPRYGSGSASRKMSSPCSVPRTGTPSIAACSAGTMPESRTLVRLHDSGRTRRRSQSTSFSHLLAAGCRARPGASETVRSPSCSACVLTANRDTQRAAGAVEQPVEEPGRVAEQPALLLQVDVDAAEEDAVLADVVLVGADRRVGRDQQGVVARAAAGRRRACCRACSCRSTCPRRRR